MNQILNVLEIGIQWYKKALSSEGWLPYDVQIYVNVYNNYI